MQVKIICDNENTVRFLDYLISMGSCNSRKSDLEDLNIDPTDAHLSVTYTLDVKPTVEMDINIKNSTSKKKKDDKIYLYAARDSETGKLVSDLTNPRRKYWDREGNARSAINGYNRHTTYYGQLGRHQHVDLVKFQLVEVPLDDKD